MYEFEDWLHLIFQYISILIFLARADKNTRKNIDRLEYLNIFIKYVEYIQFIQCM